MNKTVHLGFAVGTGEPVSIPLRHMVVTGQTQEAGKTTTLEALIARADVKAIAFVTKRGEGSFRESRIIPPYFREQSDWKYVASILEASRKEKLKFERSWIIRASRGARSLAEVQRNVRKAMETAKGIHADVYLTLDAYLDDVVPQIESITWAKRVQLGHGLNVMDLTKISEDMQHLVIRSTLDWVLQHEEGTVVVVPEAWKFIPQGRGTPVRLAAESYIRQAAGLGNYLWLDSQDIAGVEKIILKSVPVWILGVQRESNEIKRTLAQIPEGIATPKRSEIATLGLGEFFACYGRTTIKVYVQPDGMDAGSAIDVAKGIMDARDFKRVSSSGANVSNVNSDAEVQASEDTVTPAEARALREENETLKRQIEDLSRQLRAGTYAPERETVGARAAATAKPASAPAPVSRIDTRVDAPSSHPFSDNGDEALYQRIRARLLAEEPAALLRLVKLRPEIEVSVERKTVTIDGATPKGRVVRLLADGFFTTARRQGETRSELRKTGTDVNPGTLSKIFTELVVDGFLINTGSARYQAVSSALVRIIE